MRPLLLAKLAARPGLLGRKAGAGLFGGLANKPALAARTLGPRGAAKLITKKLIGHTLIAGLHTKAAAINSRKAKLITGRAAKHSLQASLHNSLATRKLIGGKRARLF
jgi:hypothetical protein